MFSHPCIHPPLLCICIRIHIIVPSASACPLLAHPCAPSSYVHIPPPHTSTCPLLSVSKSESESMSCPSPSPHCVQIQVQVHIGSVSMFMSTSCPHRIEMAGQWHHEVHMERCKVRCPCSGFVMSTVKYIPIYNNVPLQGQELTHLKTL